MRKVTKLTVLFRKISITCEKGFIGKVQKLHLLHLISQTRFSASLSVSDDTSSVHGLTDTGGSNATVQNKHCFMMVDRRFVHYNREHYSGTLVIAFKY